MGSWVHESTVLEDAFEDNEMITAYARMKELSTSESETVDEFVSEAAEAKPTSKHAEATRRFHKRNAPSDVDEVDQDEETAYLNELEDEYDLNDSFIDDASDEEEEELISEEEEEHALNGSFMDLEAEESEPEEGLIESDEEEAEPAPKKMSKKEKKRLKRKRMWEEKKAKKNAKKQCTDAMETESTPAQKEESTVAASPVKEETTLVAVPADQAAAQGKRKPSIVISEEDEVEVVKDPRVSADSNKPNQAYTAPKPVGEKRIQKSPDLTADASTSGTDTDTSSNNNSSSQESESDEEAPVVTSTIKSQQVQKITPKSKSKKLVKKFQSLTEIAQTASEKKGAAIENRMQVDEDESSSDETESSSSSDDSDNGQVDGKKRRKSILNSLAKDGNVISSLMNDS